MAMYYYASKLNEASCSGCSVKVPPVSETAASSTDLVPLTADPTLLHGSGLSYYDVSASTTSVYASLLTIHWLVEIASNFKRLLWFWVDWGWLE